MKDKLQPLRSKIDEIDAKLVRLLNERTKLVLEIGKIKHAAGERDLRARPRRGGAAARYREESRAAHRGIVARDLPGGDVERVGAGKTAGDRLSSVPQATYSHMAAVKKFGASLRYEPLPSITDVFTEVAKGRADYGVVPIENSTEGAVTHTYDMFVDSELKVCAQIVLPIRHNLMAACPRDQIKKLYSISQVFAQCRQWLQLNMPHVELVEVSSSTRAAEIAKSEPNAGALASALAAELYGLTVYDPNIQDSSENVTRFLVIGGKYPPRTGNDKTSIMFAVQDRVGALHDCISSFKKFKINMTKIESRPSRKKAWEYYFFVDFNGHCDDARVKKSLAELAKHTMFVKILGSYPNVNG